MNDGPLSKVAVNAKSVDQKMIGSGLKCANRFEHSQLRRVINVDLVNASGIYGCGRVTEAMLANALGEYIPTFPGKEFRIAQSANAIFRIENDGGRNYAPEERSAPNFIHSGNQLGPFQPRFLFVPQGAA